MQAQPDDFMAGFNDDGDADGSTQPAITTDAGDAGDGTAGAGSTGGSVDGAGQTATGAAPPSDAFAAGLAGEAQPGGENSSTQGVDIAQNGEQGRVESQELDLSSLPESVRQRLEEADRLKQQVEQLDGSLAATRRDYQAAVNRVAPLQQQLAALQKPAQPAPQTDTTQAGSGGAAGVGGLAQAEQAIADAEAYFDSPEFKRYEEQWPDEAKVQRTSQMQTLKAVRTMHAQLEQQVGDVSRTVQTQVVPHLEQVRHNEAVNARERELSDLSTQHPDWREINVSPEFKAWFEKQKPLLNFRDDDHMRERVNDGAYVSSLLTSYKESTGATSFRQQDPPPVQDATVAAPSAGAAKQEPSGASARLAMSGGPGKTGVAVIKRPDATGVTPGDDFMAGFTET